MPEPMPYECSCTDFPICPYCGHEEHDCADINREGKEYTLTCGNCEMEYTCQVEFTVTFDTFKLASPDPTTPAQDL